MTRNKTDLLNLVTLVAKTRSGELTCMQVACRYIENIEANRTLNAFIHFNRESVVEQARRLDAATSRGRLHGVPLIIKDCIHVRDMPNTAGSAALKHFVPNEDADVVKKVRAEGALLLGKSNMDEMFFNSLGENKSYGNICNPHETNYSAGGSSGGVGCAIASSQALAGLGSDTNGSIRIPSSMTGVFGLRPTVGRYSRRGMTPMSSTCDTMGPMARSMQDLIYLDQVITGETIASQDLKTIRVGIPKNYLTDDLDSEVELAFEKIKNSLRKHENIKLVEVDMKQIEAITNKLSMIISKFEATYELQNYLNEYKVGLNLDELTCKIETPDIRKKFETFIRPNAPKAISKEKYDECIMTKRPRLISEYKKLFGENQLHVLVYPSISCEPVRFDRINEKTMWFIARNCLATSNACLPSLTLPMGKSKHGLPIGLEIDALWNQDAQLLQIGSKIHQCL